MKKPLLLILLLLTLLTSACAASGNPSPEEETTEPTVLITFDVETVTQSLDELQYSAPLFCESDRQTLNGITTVTYSFSIDHQAVTLLVESAEGQNVFAGQLEQGATKAVSFGGNEWFVSTSSDGLNSTTHCCINQNGRSYHLRAVEPEDLPFFSSVIAPSLTFAAAG